MRPMTTRADPNSAPFRRDPRRTCDLLAEQLDTYLTAGHFSRFLVETRGWEAYGRIIRGESFDAVYGESAAHGACQIRPQLTEYASFPYLKQRPARHAEPRRDHPADGTRAVDDVEVTSFVVEGSAVNLQTYVQPLTIGPSQHTIRITHTNFIDVSWANISNNVIVSSVQVRSLQMDEGPGRSLVYVCDPVGANADACFEQIIETFASRAWRREI